MVNLFDLVKYFRNYWLTAAGSILATGCFEIFDLIIPYVVGQIINVLSQQGIDPPIQFLVNSVAQITNQPVNQLLTLWVLMGVVFVSTVVRAPIQPWIGSWFHWAIALRTRHEHNQKAIKKILTLPLEFYDENNPGRVAGRIARGLGNHTWTYPEIAGQLFPKAFRVLAVSVIMALIDWRIAGLFLFSCITTLGLSFAKLRELVDLEETVERYGEDTESRTAELVTNIKTVKAFATESRELDRQRQRLDRELKVILYKIHIGYVKLGTFQRTLVQLSVFIVIGLALISTWQGQMSLGYFITLITISSIAHAEIEPISNLTEVFARRYASMQRFHEFMKQPIGLDGAGIVIHPQEKPRQYNFTGKVEFVGVGFGYDADRPVLRDVNLLIEPCQTVALVGRSGSGKSTLIKLLFRYFDPDQGKILIDGEDIRRLDITGYRKRLAIVHQEVDVFNGTIFDNLTYGNPKASWEQVREACQVARVEDFIPQLPNGYGTIVGERGVRLSGGQRQRLGIARALLVEPDILVFDEATSSLDYESERAIQLAMRNIQGTRTTIIIAHRLSTVREADKIVVLDQGKIAEVGSHQQLLDHQGIYHRLHSLQSSGEFV